MEAATNSIKDVLKSDELRFFLGVVVISTLAVSANVFPLYRSARESFRYAFFQVASIISTTGFATADYMNWPVFSQLIMVMLLLCGACAGACPVGAIEQ